MKPALRLPVIATTLALLAAGCATKATTGPQNLSQAKSPLYSIKDVRGEMAIAVSPTGRTLRIAGTTGGLIGAGVDAIANDRYRRKIEEALGDINIGALYEEIIESELNGALSAETTRVQPFGGWSGYPNQRAAEDARFENMYEDGGDILLETRTTYGIVGTQGQLIAKLESKLHLLPSGRQVYDKDIVVALDPIIATMPLGDPTGAAVLPNFSNPRLKAEDDAISQWTEDGGDKLRAEFREALRVSVAALLTDLGVANDADGLYYLGKNALIRKKFDDAEAYFKRALALEPDMVLAKNGLAVNAGLNDDFESAAAQAEAIVADHPDFGPAWFSLAYWYAEELENPTRAKECYARALELGMAPLKKIDKELEK